jgi:cytochrome b involved in lipid metabolism
MSGSYTEEEVSRHNTPEDCWIIVDGKVYDVSKFLSSHPGGPKIIIRVAGQDATKQFQKFHDVGVVLRKFVYYLSVTDC